MNYTLFAPPHPFQNPRSAHIHRTPLILLHALPTPVETGTSTGRKELTNTRTYKKLFCIDPWTFLHVAEATATSTCQRTQTTTHQMGPQSSMWTLLVSWPHQLLPVLNHIFVPLWETRSPTLIWEGGGGCPSSLLRPKEYTELSPTEDDTVQGLHKPNTTSLTP